MGRLRVEMPRKLGHISVGQLKQVFDIRKSDDEDLMRAAKIVGAVSGVNWRTLYQWPGGTEFIAEKARDVVKLIASYTPNTPPKEIVIDGERYMFCGKSKKWTAGQYVDIKTNRRTMIDKWEMVPAILYVEKGMRYGQTTENGFLLNPMNSRAEVFKDRFPADVYLDVNAFFLKKFVRSMPSFTVEEAIDQTMMEVQKMVEKQKREISKQMQSSNKRRGFLTFIKWPGSNT